MPEADKKLLLHQRCGRFCSVLFAFRLYEKSMPGIPVMEKRWVKMYNFLYKKLCRTEKNRIKLFF